MEKVCGGARVVDHTRLKLLFHATREEMMKEMQPQLPQDVMMAEEQPHVDWEAMGATAKSNNGQGKVKG